MFKLDFRSVVPLTTTGYGSLSITLFLLCKSHFRFHSVHFNTCAMADHDREETEDINMCSTSLIEKEKNFIQDGCGCTLFIIALN